jgi:hypothetical protein
VVHDLQQDVEDVGVRLFDFVQEHDRIRVLAHRVNEEAALFEPNVPRRRADEPRHRVLLHVLAHVEAQKLVAEVHRELLGELGLADAGRAREEEAPGRAIGLAKPGARTLDGAGDGTHGLFLAKDDAPERLF